MTKGMTSFVSLPQDHDLVDLVGRIFPEILSFKTRRNLRLWGDREKRESWRDREKEKERGRERERNRKLGTRARECECY